MSDEKCCSCPEEVNVPITGITVPLCGFGVNIDASKLPKCECDLSREEIQDMIDKAIRKVSPFLLCEFYFFRHPTLRPGFQPAYGSLITDAATLYPEAWTYLQTSEGQILCTSEENWQTMRQAIWHTNADRTTEGWDSIGGAPYYVQDIDAGTLRLPDLRGMYIEAAGFDGLVVGGAHGDGVRNITGSIINRDSEPLSVADTFATRGALSVVTKDTPWGWVSGLSAGGSLEEIHFDASRAVPIANKNQPRAWGALPCVYLGCPAP